ncbi:MAG TPA: DUF2244 domain-containing protein [Noviherbaspirillum sp.]|uniref:DUF2244 domain-containing protein n=1 Tax=Noviherbaspirillum sp. TaxID=1926288 RepID=UPI002B4956BB|nr:DUF2244 domain-containing protein [Noviherbaspirillum sp.]HJV86364.1 DUF2244 domain-containing protein [Noviherbaspirillum sp.]
MQAHEWLLKRNCSLSPWQLAVAFAVPCVASLLVSAWFVLHGAWYVLAFALLEALALVMAFIQYARHATDHEHIALAGDCLLVEQIQAGHIVQVRLDPQWTRVAPPDPSHDLIGLEAKGVRVEVGRFVTKEKRWQVALEIRQELQRGPSIHAHA